MNGAGRQAAFDFVCRCGLDPLLSGDFLKQPDLRVLSLNLLGFIDRTQQRVKRRRFKQAQAEYLQQSMERCLRLKPFFNDRYQHVAANSDPYLSLHGVGAVAHESFDAQILLGST